MFGRHANLVIAKPMNVLGFSLHRIRQGLLTTGQWCAAATLFAAPINKPALNILLGLSLIFSILGTDCRLRWRTALREPVVIGFLIWFAVLLASALNAWLSHNSNTFGESFLWSCTYPAIIASLLVDSRWRWRALAIFAAATALVVLASYCMQLGLMPQRAIADAVPSMRNTVFKEYTQQGLSSLVLCGMVISLAASLGKGWARTLLLWLALLILCNVLFIIKSRTTYLVLPPLIAYWAYRMLRRHLDGWRVALMGTIITLSLVTVIWNVPPVHDRLAASISSEFQRYVATREPTSTGTRLWLWQHSLPIIAEAPVFGHGLKQWATIYTEQMQHTPGSAAFVAYGHPHQEELQIMAEQGIVGLAIFLGLVVALARHVGNLPEPQRDIYICLMLIYLTAGLANGLWVDFTHRHIFLLLLACIPRRPPLPILKSNSA